MTFAAKRIEYVKEHIYVIELELDYCSNTFGVLPCVGGIRLIVTDSVSNINFSDGDFTSVVMGGHIMSTFQCKIR